MTKMEKKSRKWFAAICFRGLLFLALCGIVMLSSCSSDSDNVHVVLPTKARIVKTVRYDQDQTTAFNFEYPSTDPDGNEIMLSGTITMGDEVMKDRHARGLLLYNHYTVYRADQCPSKGYLAIQKKITGSGLITISADYYGFGITEDKMQAYCISRCNAQASVDALIQAKILLANMGYEWDDVTFNAGYSEGGQTAIGVLRLVTEKYPSIRFAYTFAGGGSYDIPETYRQMLQTGETAMPSTVISVLLSYNEYFSLGIPRSDIFQEPVLSHIDEWFLSKEYDADQIDANIASTTIADWVTPAMLDFGSEPSMRYMAALDQDNLCKGWQPRRDERILLVHHTEDQAVPVANATNLHDFLVGQGVTFKYGDYNVADYGSLGKLPAHQMGAVRFMLLSVDRVCKVLDINPWISLTPQDLYSFLY